MAGAAPVAPALAQSTNPAGAPAAAKSVADVTRGMQSQAGFIDVWRDTAKGRVLLSVVQLEQPFLLLSSLPYALGSNDVGLDRGQAGDMRMVHFEKHGAKLFLVQDNTGYIAASADKDERAAVTESFANAVLWSGDILASEGGAHLVDFSGFLLADRHGIAARLAAAKQGAYVVDPARSAVLAEQAKAFPDNVELESLLTFAGPGQAEYVRQVAADPASLSMRQRISMVRLPQTDAQAGGWRPRGYHPFSGGFDVSYYDFATPLSSSIDVHWQVRHRLEKTDPAAAVSAVKKPIVYYVDRGAPEPVRSALLQGASWWASAFEKAGFKDAYRVELLPEGADAMDIRYNVIHWVHRATRGWSYGNALADPRTGQIIRGAVTLGSQRVRQDILIAESLLAPYGKNAPADKHKLAEEMALARLRQLAAHEVGHTLGFAHNFAASRMGNGNGSVMDYPHPILKLDARGEVDLADAYGVGVGPGTTTSSNTSTAISAPARRSRPRWPSCAARPKPPDCCTPAIRTTARRAPATPTACCGTSARTRSRPGINWARYASARCNLHGRRAARRTPDRRAGSAPGPRLSASALPGRGGCAPDRWRRFRLHHQRRCESRHRQGGRQDHAGRRAAPGAEPACRQLERRVSGAARQRARCTDTAGDGHDRGREYFATRMGSVFDAFSIAEAGAAQTMGFLLDPGRVNRLSWQHARDAQQPGVQETLSLLMQRTWKREPVPPSVVGGEAVQLAANWVLIDGVLNLLDGGKLHPNVAAEVTQSARELAQWLQKIPAKA